MGLHYKLSKSVIKQLKDVTCDKCGKKYVAEGGNWNPWGEPFSMFHDSCAMGDYIVINCDWGYGSAKDGERHEIVLCENCYNKIFKGVKIRISGDWKKSNEDKLDVSEVAISKRDKKRLRGEL